MEENKRVIFRQFEDVVLRPADEADIPHLTRWANDPDVTVYLNLYLPMTKMDEKDWVQNKRANPNEIVLIIELVQEGSSMVPVGTIGLHGISTRDRTATLGILIGEKEYWGKGIGEKALRMILEYAFNTINLRKVNLGVFSSNERAMKLYEKCDFFVEGVLKENRFRNGEYLDETHMAIFQRDWLKKR